MVIIMAVAKVGGRCASVVAGPHRFIVTWGRMGRFDFVAETVEAWDPDDALVTAAELRPELPRPRVAVLAFRSGPSTFGHRPDQESVEPE